jgi:hypothetical protein
VSDILSDFNQIWIFSIDFHEVPHIKFHGILLIAMRSDTSGQTDSDMDGQKDRQTEEHRDGWTGMTNPIGTYRYYTKVPGNA